MNKIRIKKLRRLFFIFSLALIFAVSFSFKSSEKVVIPAHSHNDYEHEHPLFDALDHNFKSIEADVYLKGDSLFVAHDVDKVQHGRTLRKLYLEPLKNRIIQKNGSVYGNGEEVILLIDIKDNALQTYNLLHKILEEYKSILTVFENGQKKNGAITVVVSGNRPFEFMKSQKIRWAGFDGRLENLNSGISPTLMPMVSDNWGKYFSWDGITNISAEEKQKLHCYAADARKNGYILRFWGTPNNSHEQRIAVWKELKEVGVGLIGADNLDELHDFLTNNPMQPVN